MDPHDVSRSHARREYSGASICLTLLVAIVGSLVPAAPLQAQGTQGIGFGSAAVAYTEDATPVVVASQLTIDAALTNITAARVSINTGYQQGQDVLGTQGLATAPPTSRRSRRRPRPRR